MASVGERIRDIRKHIPPEVNLVCVSKFHPVEAVREAYHAGERDFGESRVQELAKKVPVLPQDIRWHFIGHLQSNKVRDLLRLRPYLIQSVDSEKLLRTINDEAEKQGIVQNVLLEVHTAKEETKTGLTKENIRTILDNTKGCLQSIRILGLMTMATNTDDEVEIRRCFEEAHALLPLINVQCPIFSAGMSDDYEIAIECGSNCVRIGSAIFGSRSYSPKDDPTAERSYSATVFQSKGRSLPKAVFFDQDGVLFNSMPYHAKAWELAMSERGLPFTAQDAYRNEGRTGASVIEEAHQKVYGSVAPQTLIDEIYAAKSAHFLRLTGNQLPEMIPGVLDLLRYLHQQGVQCWVVTGSGQHALFDNLSRLTDGILARERMITAFDVTHGKPDPEPYLRAWERSGFRKEECFVVENAPLGVRAGKAAGLYTIAVNTGPLPDSMLREEGADQVFPDMSTLREWLAAR